MHTSYPVIRGGPVLVVLALFATATSAHAAAQTTVHRYTIQGSLEPAVANASASAAPMPAKSRLSTPTQDVGLQAGGDFVMMAKLALSPLVCYGDTIFRDGFDGTGP